MKGRRITVFAAAVLAGLVCFTGYEWMVHIGSMRRRLPAMRGELAAIAVPGSDIVQQRYESYKAAHALVGETIVSSMSSDDVLTYYGKELARLGWSPTKVKAVKIWSRSYGGKEAFFEKRSYSCSVYHSGSAAAAGEWNYAVEVSFGLR